MAKPKRAPIPPTREQIIAGSVERLKTGRFAPREIALPTRKLAIGQKVTLGGLIEPFVVEILDHGRIIVLEHTAMGREYHDGHRVPIGQSWGAHWWFDVFPLTDYQGLRFARDRVWRHSYIQTPVDSLINRACSEEFRDNPDYQRGYVWTLSDKQHFIASLFAGREVGRFVFVEYPYPDNEYEILDGKQRLGALKEFVLGLYGLPLSGTDRLWHAFSHSDRSCVENRMIQYVQLDGSRMKRSELLEIFLEVNVAGVPQAEEHLDRVRQLYQQALAAEADG